MPPSNFSELTLKFVGLIGLALPVILGFAVLVFFWGLVKFIFRIGGDEKAIADGKKLMVWGLIALFILVSLMSILAFMQREVGFYDTGFFLLPEGN